MNEAEDWHPGHMDGFVVLVRLERGVVVRVPVVRKPVDPAEVDRVGAQQLGRDVARFPPLSDKLGRRRDRAHQPADLAGKHVGGRPQVPRRRRMGGPLRFIGLGGGMAAHISLNWAGEAGSAPVITLSHAVQSPGAAPGRPCTEPYHPSGLSGKNAGGWSVPLGPASTFRL